MTLAADPGSLQGAVAAGILGAGPVILGTAGECARLLEEAQERRRGPGGDRRAGLARPAGACPGSATRSTGPVDPRAERILELADARGVSGPYVALARAFRAAAAEVWGKPLPMNVSMPIAAVMLDLGFAPSMVKAVPVLARTAGILAHLAEEQAGARRVRARGRRRGGRRLRASRRVMLEPEVEARAWEEQLAIDDASYREQLGYLLDRSAFYREKLGQAGIEGAADAGGLDEIAPLPLTEKHELRETVTPDNPVGSHLCARPEELVRIYSTSGTTGTPSFIPLTAGDLDELGHGLGAQLRRLGHRRGQRIVSTYNAGPVRGRRRARIVRPDRPLPRPGRHRQHRAARHRDRAPSRPRRPC